MLAGVGDRAVLCWARGRGWEPSGLTHRGQVGAVAFHPNGRTLAYSAVTPFQRPPGDAPDGFTGVRLYPLGATPEFKPEVLPFDGSELHPAPGLAFAPDGRSLFSCRTETPLLRAARQVVLRWDLSTSGPAWARVTAAELTHVPAPGGVAVVDPATVAFVGAWGVRVCPFVGDPGALRVRDVSRAKAVAVAPASELVASAEETGFAVWHLRDAHAARVVRAPLVTAIALAPDGSALATGHADGTVGLWGPLAGEPRATFDFGVGAVRSLAFSPDGLTLAVGGRKGAAVVDVG